MGNGDESMPKIRMIALSVLAGATLAVGAAAAVAFPTMKALDPVLGAYAAWPDPHWPIAAGAVANRLFRMLDWVALVVAVVALVSVVVSLRGSGRSARGVVCAIAVVGLAAVVGVNWAWLRPTMHTHLQAYWEGARTGEIEPARVAREAFDRLHPVASWMLMAQVGLSLVGAAASVPGRVGGNR
jgi:hypothetical protein